LTFPSLVILLAIVVAGGRPGPVLVELSVVEQRYHAVMEVLAAGATKTDVAGRYGVSRQSVHEWVRRYQTDGLPGLADRSHRPKHHPAQMPPEVEAA
jgi:transposase-like protein